MPLVLNQSQGAQDRSFPDSFLHTPIPEQSPKHRRSRSQQIQKHNSHIYRPNPPPIIDRFPPHLSHQEYDPHSPQSPQSGHLPPISSLQANLSPFSEPVQIASPISPEEMEHPRPKFPDEPIDDHEWVYIFSSIIRQGIERGTMARHASQVLYDAIQQTGGTNFEPVWEDVALPGGRSLATVRDGYRQFTRQGPYLRTPGQHIHKRPLPMDSQTVTGRGVPIAPKPSSAGPSGPIRQFPAGSPATISPLTTSHVGLDSGRRKRGRPSKKEQEERRLRGQGISEARLPHSGPTQPNLYSPGMHAGSHFGQIGEIPASPAPSAAPAYGTARTTPQAPSRAGSNNNSGSSGSGKRRRGRPPGKAAATGPPPPFSLSPESRGATGPSSFRETQQQGQATIATGSSSQQQAGRREAGRESETSTTRARQGAPLAPHETAGASSSRTGKMTGEAEEGKSSQARFKNLLND